MGVLRFLVGVLLIPFCVAITWTTASLVASIPSHSAHAIPASAWAFAGGFLLWGLLYAALPMPVRTYVLAHELTHALWAYLTGARVVRMNIAQRSGSVTLSKCNFLVALAPYFFPLYTVLVILSYCLASVFLDVNAYHLWWLGLVGFTWCFHVTFTVSALLQRQTDVQVYGRLFSYAFIYALNLLGICLCVVLVSSATLEQMAGALRVRLVAVTLFLWRAAALAADGRKS